MQDKLGFCNFADMQKTKTPKRARTLHFYETVRSEYRRLSAITEYGKSKYSYEWIVAELSLKFFKSERTIENIIFNRV